MLQWERLKKGFSNQMMTHFELSKLEVGEVTLTRKPHQHEFIQILWPIYYQNKVSFTCKDTTDIKIDSLDQKCNSAIHFQTRPQSLQINNGDDIWTHTSSNPTTFFLKSLDWDFWPRSIPKSVLKTSELSAHLFICNIFFFKMLTC